MTIVMNFIDCNTHLNQPNNFVPAVTYELENKKSFRSKKSRLIMKQHTGFL